MFCEAGPLTVFVSKVVSPLIASPGLTRQLILLKHLPPDMKYNPDATPAQYSNAAGDVIERGSAARVQIIGLRSDVGAMFAIGKMSASWFGYVIDCQVEL